MGRGERVNGFVESIAMSKKWELVFCHPAVLGFHIPMWIAPTRSCVLLLHWIFSVMHHANDLLGFRGRLIKGEQMGLVAWERGCYGRLSPTKWPMENEM